MSNCFYLDDKIGHRSSRKIEPYAVWRWLVVGYGRATVLSAPDST